MPDPPSGSPGTPSSNVSLAEPQRQSLLAILFLLLRTVRSIGIVQIVIGAGFLLSQSPSVLVLALGVLVVAAIFLGISALSWWRYTFQVEAGELRVKKGVLSQQALSVPLDRVQSVSIEQKFLHRMVGLVQVSLDTAGSSAAEFTIDAVDRDVAVALQAAAADHKANSQSLTAPVVPAQDGMAPPVASTPVAPVEERIVVQHSPKRLAKIAFTHAPFSGFAVLAPLFAFGDEIFERLPFDINFDGIDFDVGAWLIWFIPLALVAVLLASLLLNIVQTVLRDWNLRVTRTASGLRRDAGLLSTTSVASSLPRVQRIETAQGLFERWVGLQELTLHNIGDADMFVPGCTAAEAEDLRQLGLDGAEGVSSLDRRISPLAVFKATRNMSVVATALAIGVYFVLSWWSLLFLLLIPLVWLQSRRSTRLYRWGIGEDAIADRAEFIGWRRNESLLRKVNSVQVRQSLFERKRDLATVTIEFAGGTLSGGQIAIGMIPIAEAQAVRDRILYVAETDTRAFM